MRTYLCNSRACIFDKFIFIKATNLKICGKWVILCKTRTAKCLMILMPITRWLHWIDILKVKEESVWLFKRFFSCRLKIHFYLLADNTIKEQTIVIHSEGMHKVFLQSVDSVIMPHLANLWQFSMFQQGFPGKYLVILVWWKFTKANYCSMWCCNVTLTPHGSWA